MVWYAWDHEFFPFTSIYFTLLVILDKVNLGFICPNNLIPENPLDLRLERRLLIVDFKNHMSTSLRVFFTWQDTVKGFSSKWKEFYHHQTVIPKTFMKYFC